MGYCISWPDVTLFKKGDMVKFTFHFLLFLTLIILQTSIFPFYHGLKNCFDLLLVLVLFFSLNFTHPLLLIAVLLIGCCMDSLSEAPLGLYTAVYLWIFISVWGLKRLVHSGNFIFLPLISGAAVLLENSFLFLSFFVRHGGAAIVMSDLILAGCQALWAAFLIPIAILLVELLHVRCDAIDSGML